jgi:hypothetical protein
MEYDLHLITPDRWQSKGTHENSKHQRKSKKSLYRLWEKAPRHQEGLGACVGRWDGVLL